MTKPDPKPAKRVVNTDASAAKLKTDKRCRACGSFWGRHHGHHLVSRAQRGDDVEDNIVTLCQVCHQLYHEGREPIGAVIRRSLSRQEIEYVVKKKSRAWLDKKYPWLEDKTLGVLSEGEVGNRNSPDGRAQAEPEGHSVEETEGPGHARADFESASISDSGMATASASPSESTDLGPGQSRDINVDSLPDDPAGVVLAADTTPSGPEQTLVYDSWAETELLPGDPCPACKRKIPHPKKESSPTSKTVSFRVPLDAAEDFKEILDAAEEHCEAAGEPFSKYKAMLTGLILLLDGPKLRRVA